MYYVQNMQGNLQLLFSVFLFKSKERPENLVADFIQYTNVST